MSFINLMDDVIFTDDDITRRTEAMVRNEFSAEAETILNRKVSGLAFGEQMTPELGAEIQRFSTATKAAAIAGVEARSDMTRKLAAMAYESATKRLSKAHYDGPLTITDEGGVEQPHPNKVLDDQEREAATTTINNASQATLDLYALRNPEPVPEVTE